MKTIAFVCPWYGDNIPGGAEAALRGVTSHLKESGLDIEILTTTVKEFTADWNENFYKEGVTVNAFNVPVRRFAIRKRDVKAFDKVNAKLMKHLPVSLQEEEIFNQEMINSPKLYDYIREHKDEYQCFVYIPYLFGTTYNGVKACPEKAVLIPCFHDEGYAHMKTFEQVYSKAAGMLFNAQPEKDLTEKLMDISNVRTEVMGLGLDTKLTSDAERFRKKYNITNPFILYAGRKDAGKNVDTLLEYFRRYKTSQEKDNEKSLKLVLIGGGKIDIPKEIADDVVDLGFVDIQDKYDAYAAAQLLCQPSKNESFSFVIMESWLCHKPVLVHAGCDVTKHFVKDSNGGLYFEGYYEFQETINYILKHPENAKIMAENGYEYVMNHFAWDVIVRKYTEFFKMFD